VSTGDIILDWHPIMIAKIIRDAVGDKHQREIARVLGITQQYVSLLLGGERELSREVAAKLHRIGLDGRDLYAMQEQRRVEIQWRYETGAIERPSLFHVEQKGFVKRIKPHNKSVLREAAIKAAATRKRRATARQIDLEEAIAASKDAA
jgi:plasmid maintenance system antidote protein VapI